MANKAAHLGQVVVDAAGTDEVGVRAPLAVPSHELPERQTVRDEPPDSKTSKQNHNKTITMRKKRKASTDALFRAVGGVGKVEVLEADALVEDHCGVGDVGERLCPTQESRTPIHAREST